LSTDPAFKKQQENRGRHFSDYRPLLVLILVSAAAGYAAALPFQVSMLVWMHLFMGVFFCVFAMLKLFHPGAFADGFEMYDLLAQRWRPYGYIYPYLELLLGLAYLGFFLPTLTYILTIILLGFSAVGVLSALRRGLDINCPCMGSVLDVPLSTVTLTEDLGMIFMALVLLGM
jgi:hypothetical protein